MWTPPPAEETKNSEGANFSTRDNSEILGLQYKLTAKRYKGGEGGFRGKNRAFFSSELYIEERGVINFFRKGAKTGVFSRKKRENGENRGFSKCPFSGHKTDKSVLLRNGYNNIKRTNLSY